MRQFARLLLVAWISVTGMPEASRESPSERRIDFRREIEPIFAAKCQPCHFPGGKMYKRLPFDQEATIIQLGDKIFTRIKDETSRTKIRAFLEQNTSR